MDGFESHAVHQFMGMKMRTIIAILAMTVSAHAADLSSLRDTPYRQLTSAAKETADTKPTLPPCLGAVWPVKIVHCSVTVKF